VAEGGGLLNRYTLSRRIEGSNPSVSANHLKMFGFLACRFKSYFSGNSAGGQFCYRFATISYFCRWRMAARSASSTRAAASSCIPGKTWLYRSRVTPTRLWPKRSLATFG
jgi:hypothetical protein